MVSGVPRTDNGERFDWICSWALADDGEQRQSGRTLRPLASWLLAIRSTATIGESTWVLLRRELQLALRR